MQWDKLGATTKKRYAGYFAGHPKATSKDIQKARGHKEPREHARRVSRHEEKMLRRASHQAWMGQYQGARSADEIFASYQRADKDHPGWFTRLDRKLTELTENRVKQKGVPGNVDLMRNFEDFDLDDYDIDDSELFYGSEMPPPAR